MVLNKIISAFFQPMPLAFIGCVLGLILLFSFRRTAIYIISLSLLQLWLFSLSPVANLLYYNLTKRHPPVAFLDQQVDYIVVLGSSSHNNAHPSIFNKLSSTAILRLLEGVRLLKNQTTAHLWFSGINRFNISHPDLMREAAIELGVPAERILSYEDVHNTRTEIKALKENTALGDNIVIVSSSYHLPRVALWAKFYQLYPLYAPADNFAPPSLPLNGIKLLRSLVPSPGALGTSNLAIHEYLGIAHWYMLTRWRLLNENS